MFSITILGSWKRVLILVAMLLTAGVLSSSAQRKIRVPADAPSIQAGIDAAQNGDTVLVAPGTYTENIDFKGKSITVTSGAKSSADASATVIQGAREGSVVTFQSNEPLTSVLNGFTIQNAFSSALLNINSDGVDILSASPTVQNNVIQNNIGCGVLVSGSSSPLVQGNLIQGNRMPRTGETERTTCGSSGVIAGVALESTNHPQIIGNIIENSTGVDQTTGLPSTFGLYVDGGQEVLIQSNILHDNGHDFQSQARSSTTLNLEIIQNLIYIDSNVDAFIASGTYVQPSNDKVIFTNNTFYNQDTAFGVYWNSIEADNNLLYQRDFPPYELTRPWTLLSCEGQAATVLNNDLFANGFPQQDQPCALTANNIASDPQFLVDEDSHPGAGDFHTQRTSPVVYAGDINAPMIPPTDLDGKNRTVCGKIDIGVYQTHPIPPVALTSSPNPSVGGTSVTFQMAVQGNCNVPTGMLTILDGQTSIGTAVLDSTGHATFSTSDLFVGTHPITASFSGDFNFDPSVSNIVNQVVTGIPTQTSLQVFPNPAQAFQSITFTATVTSNLGVPTGTVEFYAGSQLLTTAPVLASGTAAATVSTLGAGTYTITAVYNGSVDYGTSTSSMITLVVNGATTITTLLSAPNPSVYGQTVTLTADVQAAQSSTVQGGNVTFKDGAATIGSSPLSGTGSASFNISSLAVGSHQLTAVYGGSADDNVSTSDVVIQVVNPIQTTVTLTGTPNPAPIGQTVTLTATVADISGQPLSTGTIVFADQFGTIGSAPVNAGSAILSTSTLTVGSHSITAAYMANGTYAGVTSKPFVEVIQSFDFTITLSSPTIAIKSGASFTLTAQIQGIGNVPGNVALTAAQLPQYASLAFSPTAVLFMAGGNGASVVSITTALQPHASMQLKPGWGNRSSVRILAAFCILPVFFMRRRKIRAVCLSLVGLISIASLSGCTNIYYPLSRIAPGTYVIPITGVDQASKISHTVNLTLNITR
jgi:parallel beta-helix repeat protein